MTKRNHDMSNLDGKTLICLFCNLALCITLSSLVVVVKKCQWADKSSLSLFLWFSATFCPHAWSAASSPPVCLRVCLSVASCWKSAGILLLEVFLRVDTQSQVCLQATAYLALVTTCGFVCVSLGLAMCVCPLPAGGSLPKRELRLTQNLPNSA